MKTSFVSLVMMILGWTFSAHAQAYDRLTCIYKAEVGRGVVSDVVMQFSLNRMGLPAGGSVTVFHPDGSMQNVRIPAKSIAQLGISGDLGEELTANVHVRSYDVDLVLNYAGNDLVMDVAEWLQGGSIHDLIAVYNVMLDEGFYVQQPVSQMTGSVRWNGQLRKLASSKFLCTTYL